MTLLDWDAEVTRVDWAPCEAAEGMEELRRADENCMAVIVLQRSSGSESVDVCCVVARISLYALLQAQRARGRPFSEVRLESGA